MWRTVDHVLRFAYVLLAPMILVALSTVIPVTGIIVSTGLATVVALVGPERWQARVGGIKLVGKLLGGFGRLGAYYEQHPPKPLVYYIAYPVLAPYWLVQRDARAEFLLYRRLNAITLVVVVATGVVSYAHSWYPIPFGRFVAATIATFVVQLLVTFAFVMPIVTTVIAYHRRGLRRTLVALVVLALAIAALGVLASRRAAYPTGALALRIEARTTYAHDEALGILRQAALAAGARLREAPSDRGGALERAREILGRLYRRDEVATFRLFSDPTTCVLYVRFRRKPPIWIGVHLPTGNLVERVDLLPVAARTALDVP